MMDPGDSNWAVTGGRTGVYFNPAPGNPGSIPPDVEIKAILPDRSVVMPVSQAARDDGDLVGFGFEFAPPLPDGSVVYINDTELYTVETLGR